MTTSPTALLADLQARGVELELDAGRLRFRAPTGVLTDEDRQALAAAKGEIAALVATDGDVDSPSPEAAPASRPPRKATSGESGSTNPQPAATAPGPASGTSPRTLTGGDAGRSARQLLSWARAVPEAVWEISMGLPGSMGLLK